MTTTARQVAKTIAEISAMVLAENPDLSEVRVEIDNIAVTLRRKSPYVRQQKRNIEGDVEELHSLIKDAKASGGDKAFVRTSWIGNRKGRSRASFFRKLGLLAPGIKGMYDSLPDQTRKKR